MATASENQAPKPVLSIDDFINQCPPREILLRMASQDDFSTESAVEEIVALTRAAAVEAAAAAERAEQQNNALLRHADIVTAIIIALAVVPDPTEGGILHLKDGLATTPFWSGMPRFSINLAEEALRGPGIPSEDILKSLDWANLVAFFAQLAELKFWDLFEDTSWDFAHLTQLFEEEEEVTKQDVRVACMWFIHASKKVWTDVQLRRSDDEDFFEPEFWPRWKQSLQGYQKKLSVDIANKDLQRLISCSLESINKTEAELGK
ncbi:unnamed protein product [Clonostachys byssicola]|uniref:Uncharacterized protein n=1 Tax=Clonostachys byssicola TaxID=160290 RepID=A0A9N9U4A8_9HYPO|nr:unnamed protein product [Clonostachys byssicola]